MGDKLNKKGQALVEFLLILPVLVMILFALIDFGRIYYSKITLSTKINDIDKMYKNNYETTEILKILKKEDKEVNISITKKDDKFVEYQISKNIEIITPGLSIILDNPFEVIEKRVAYDE